MSTIELITDNLWTRLQYEADKAHSRNFAVAYVTDALALNMKRGDTLVVDASDEAITSGSTTATAIEELFDKGVTIYSLPRLHAKIYVFDSCVIVGSANLSKSSQTRLHEAAILSSDRSLVRQAAADVSKFASQGEKIDPDFVQKIKLIDVPQRTRSPLTDPHTSPEQPNNETVLYCLKITPKKNELRRAYFIAFIMLQIGSLTPDKPFHLWKKKDGSKGNFDTHLKEKRLEEKEGVYFLTKTGVNYFTSQNQAAQPEFLECFLKALRTGREEDLPAGLTNKELKQTSWLLTKTPSL